MKTPAIITASILAVAIAGCASSQAQPPAKHAAPPPPAGIVVVPNISSDSDSVTRYCVHADGIYIIGSGYMNEPLNIAVVGNDPACKGKGS